MTTTIAIRRRSELDLLEAAFRSFDQAAQTLQQSYHTLTAKVEQMDLELARSNEALRKQLQDNEAMRAHLDGILESLSTGVLVLNEAGAITRSNVQAGRLLGTDTAALCGRSAADVLQSLGLSIGDRPQRIGQSMVTIARTSLRTEPGFASGSLLLIQDVTEICRLEERLQRTDRLAAMGEMIGRIAHEIRNPLGSVELFASMLRRDLVHMPHLKLYADQICQAVQGMDRLLTNLLTFTRPERAPRAWHDAEPLILDSLTLAAHAITKSPVDIRLDLDPRTPAIWCHDGQMKQVFLNLIVNAVQAMPSGGVLTIGLRRDTENLLGIPAIRITVADSGVGIDPAHRSRIFDPFFTTKDDGTGLGLAIVHAIVDAHRGRIDVDSTVGQGTSITIVLPHPCETGPSPSAAQRPHDAVAVLEAMDGMTEMALVEDGTHE